MDLHFYSDLTDGTGQHGDREFLDPGSFNGFDNKTFHTPSLGDEEFEIPPISLDPVQALTVSDVVAHFRELSDGERGGLSTAGNVVVGGDDPSFASTVVNPHPGSQGLDHHLSLGVISQPDVPLSDMGHGLLGHNQLTTIDQSELSTQLGLSLGGGAILARSQSPDQPLVLVESPISLCVISLKPPVSDSPIPSFAPSSSTPPTLVRRGGAAGGGKKGKKKKEPKEKPVYKRKTEAAKKEYLKALAAYRDNQLSQPTIEVLDTAPSPPSPPPVAPLPNPDPRSTRSSAPHLAPEENTITNICTSNIILAGVDLPQVTTRSRTGAHKPPAPMPALAPSPPTVTKIIIKQQTSPSGVMVVSGSTVLSARQPPPLQQMQNTPPPPRLQQMGHAQAPPPLQAKPRGGGAMAPPPLQIKIVPPASDLDSPDIVTVAGGLAALGGATPTSGEVVQSTAIVTACSTEAEDRAEGEEGMQVELNVSPGPDVTQTCSPNLCVRVGCTNPAVENKDWDREDVFMAWCAIRGQNSTVT
ncbi:unnamed protein product [Coregonus sp. 'balchen']|nr:unnamed protein product [Coregonus sp. 'balchen']